MFCCNGRISPGSMPRGFLERYRNQLCTFNDDIQGTAAVATGTLLSAISVTGIPLQEQRVAFLGFGGAGIGIAQLIHSLMKDAGLSAQKPMRVLSRGPLRPDYRRRKRRSPGAGTFCPQAVRSGRMASVQSRGNRVARCRPPREAHGADWCLRPAGAFTEEAIRTMAKNTERPVIFPLSNPTSRCEAKPQDLLDWTEGRALIGTGSPFGPARVNGREVQIAQTNNSYIFRAWRWASSRPEPGMFPTP